MINASSFNIKFLEWAEIDYASLCHMGITSSEKVKVKAYISPDVKSLHIIWVEIFLDGTWSWYHEIADYTHFIHYEPSEENEILIQTVLQNELFDDSMECGDEDGEKAFYKNVLSDYGEDLEAPRAMKLSEIMKDGV